MARKQLRTLSWTTSSQSAYTQSLLYSIGTDSAQIWNGASSDGTGISNALPINNNTVLDGVSQLAIQPCINPNNRNTQPSVMTSTVASTQDDFPTVSPGRSLNSLKIELTEATDKINAALVTMRPWTSLLDSSSRQRTLNYLKQLQIPAFKHNTLSAETNSKLRVQEQLSIYTYFLLKQENETALDAYGNNGTALVKDIRIKIMRCMCILRGLLPLAVEEMNNFVQQDVAGHLIPLGPINNNVAANFKRAICSIGVNMILETINLIQVSVENGTVTLPDNM